MHSHPRFVEAFATARITAFNPGQSPPPVTTPIRLLMWSFYCLCGQPGVAIFADERDAFIDRVYAMRNFEIDLAGEFIVFLKHRPAPPLNQFGPHFADEDQWRVVEFADLEKLPRERQLQQSSDTAWNDHKCVGHNHEMVQPRKECAVFVCLANERVYRLFEWKLDTNSD